MANASWGPGWPNAQTSKIVPLSAGGVSFPGGVRSEIKELMTLLVTETERRGYQMTAGQCWGFANRPIRGTRVASNHSWGLALDINAPRNPMGSTLVTDMPSWMPDLWNVYGFRWGGDYSGRKDAMHYEFMGSVADCAVYTGRARAAFSGAKPPAPVRPGGPAPQFPYPADHYLGEASKSPRCHSGFYAADRPNVAKWQAQMRARGWVIAADGVYGPVSTSICRRFQGEKGIRSDGLVGPTTWRASWTAPVTR